MSEKKRKYKRWTKDEIQIIKDNWENMNDKELHILIPNHNPKSISTQREKMGLLHNLPYERYNYQDFANLLATREYLPISTENDFKSGDTYMEYWCPKHGIKKTKLTYLINGRFCRECGKDIVSKKLKKDINFDDDKQFCESFGYEYVTTTRDRGKSGQSQILINFICPKHKEHGVQKTQRSNMNRGVECCKYCSRRNIPKDDLIKDLQINSPHIKILSDFKSTSNKVDYFCTIHKYRGRCEISKIILGKCCFWCGVEKAIEKNMFSQDYIENMISENNPEIEFVDEYKGNNKMYSLKCKKCGFIWKERIHKILLCPNCNGHYKGEQVVNNYLFNNNINFKTQKIFKDCKDKRPLRFDFYLPDENLCIEYQGQQHYYPIKLFGGDEYFSNLQRHDQIKRDYCNNNGIKLLEIPYTYDTKEKIEQFLKENIA